MSTIVMPKGDHETVRFSVLDSSGATVDTTGWAFTFTVKTAGTDVSAQFSKTSGGGEITAVGGNNYQWDIAILPADTSGMDAGAYVYDIEAVTAATLTKTISIGAFKLLQDVTN